MKAAMKFAMKFYVVVRKMGCCLLMEINSSELRIARILGSFLWRVIFSPSRAVDVQT